jgi:predicted nucleic acid-binding protein
MSRIPTIYLETTIFNFPFADDSPQYRADTLRLLAEIKAGKFKPFTSEYVTRELEAATDPQREDRLRLIEEYEVEVIPASDDVDQLALLYIKEGVISEKYPTDALHIAAVTVAGLDFIVSLNFRHIVKRKTIIETEIINAREGFRRVFIHTPAEVIDHDENF